MLKKIPIIMLAGVVLVVLLFSGLLAAQQGTASIQGVVLRDDGSPLPGAAIEATSPMLVGKAAATTDPNGRFELLGLAPGIYKLTITAAEGLPVITRAGIDLIAHPECDLKIIMQPSGDNGAALDHESRSDLTSAARGTTLARETLDLLPRGRTLPPLETLIPGAMNEALAGGLTFNGASAGENMFYVDGQNVNSVFGGQGAQSVIFDFVDEVAVKSSGFAAEFAGALGGVVNVVTRSGGNEFHGDIVGYYSGSALRGTERNTIILDPMISQPTLREFNYDADFGQADKDSRLEGGFGLGGYIIKDKLWFYANALPVFRTATRQAIYLAPSDPAHAPSDPFNGVIHKYAFKQTHNDLNFQAKLSARPVENMHVSLSLVNNYNVWHGALPSRAGGSSDSYDWEKLGYGTPNYSVSGNVDYTLGNNLMVSARAGYFFLGTQNKLDPGLANTHFDPQYIFTLGNTTIAEVPVALRRPTGWQSLPTQAMTYPYEVDEESNLSAGADFTCFLNLAGEHAWKAGLAFVRASVNKNTLFNAPQIIYSGWRSASATLPARVSAEVRGGTYSRANPYFPATGQYGEYGNVSSNRLAVYLQDSWTIANKLTLNFGVRLEQENVPSFNGDPAYADYIGMDVAKWGLLDKVSPRFGFVYDVMGDSSLKIYGSYGIYNDVMELDMALRAFGGMRWISDLYYIYDFTKIFEFGKLKPDGTRDYSAGTYRGSNNYRYQYWEYLDPDLKPMSQSEITFGIEKKLSESLSLSARGTWRNLIRTIEDVGMFIFWDNREVHFFTNPGERWALPYPQGRLNPDIWPCPKAQRDYRALDISLEKRMSNNWMGGVNLTFSRLFGNYTGIVSADEAVAYNGSAIPGDNMTSYFDKWWLPYKSNGKQELSNGVLPTDRPVAVKAYGSYAFPFGLTLGGVVNAMSGTPKSTEFFVDQIPGYYPLGRNDLGRTPGLWFLNLYAEYSLKLGRNALQFSVNVDNVTNNDTATWYYNCINNRSAPPFWESSSRVSYLAPFRGTDNFIKNGYDLFAMEGTWPQAYNKWTRDPRYNMPILFQSPISARLGVKFIF